MALVETIEKSFAERFPKTSRRGRRPVATRVLLALELLKHELGPRTSRFVIAYAPILPSCMPVALSRSTWTARKSILSSHRRWPSFAVVSMRP
jgi:hypothetical protein